MSRFSDVNLLTVWERGLGLAPGRRGLLLLTAWAGELPVAPEDLSIGQRDSALLEIRERIFGAAIAGLAPCPACSEPVEFSFGIDDIRTESATAMTGEVKADGIAARWRLPTCHDLVELEGVSSLAAAQHVLLGRCLTEVRRDETPLTVNECPATLRTRVSEAMAAADPQADVRLELSCPACGHSWHVLFDVLTYLWGEIELRARKLLRQVHRLASAYGWSESAILAMGTRRREAYLEVLDG
jgi:hypothetical protein